jgi:hypothetical protein
LETGKQESLSAELVDTLREELDEHLDTINGNTTEIQASIDYTSEVEAKVDKLAEKMDRILQMLENQDVKQSTTLKPLNLREQEVFLSLYTTDEFMSYTEVAEKISLPESMIPPLVDAIIGKGVPILKKYQGPSIFVQIDNEFKDIQTKENVLNINEFVMKSVVTQ